MKVIVIVARGCHLGYLGPYGNPWLATPNLDQLAADGVVFDQHYADVPSPEGARRSWQSGRYHWMGELPPGLSLFDYCQSANIRVSTLTEFQRLPKSAPLIWIETAMLLPPWKPADELSDSDDEESLEPWLDPPIGLINPADDEAFLRLQQTYAIAVAAFDEALGQLLDKVSQDTMLIVTSDHGLPLGEHGAVGLCRPWLHDELVHLPLIIRLPGNERAGQRIAAFTQSVDLMPTVLEALELPIPDGLHGHSLLPMIRGKRESIRDFACSGLQCEGTKEWAIRTPDWCLIVPATDSPRRRQLYVKPDDRWEVNDLAQHHPDLADGLEQTLHAFIAASQQPGSLLA